MNKPETTSQAELYQIILGLVDNLGTHISIYLTVVSAYLVVAYLAGKNLTRLQVSVATFIYVVFYAIEAGILVVLYRSITNAVGAYRERFSVNDPSSIEFIVSAQYAGLIVIVAIFVSSLWFMASVRRSKQ